MARPPRWFPLIPLAAVVISLPVPGIPYVGHKLLHVLGAVLFVGNVTVTGAWMAWAVGRNEAGIAAFAAAAVNRADRYFTSPGSILLLLNGLTMVGTTGVEGFRAGWIAAGLVLFIATAAIYGGGLRRYQRRMEELSARAAEAKGALPPEFHAAFRRWTAWGITATLLLFAAIVVMVVRPA